MRSLARAFSSSRRAPPMQASKPNSAIASSSVTDWCGVAALVGALQHDAAARDRVLDRAHDQALAQLGGARVAERDHFGKVVPGVDVQQREREAARAERLLGQAQQHERVLAAGEQQRGIARTRPATSRRMWIASDSSQSRWSASARREVRARRDRAAVLACGARLRARRRHDVVDSVAVRRDASAGRPRDAGRIPCAPGCSHHQRPARTSSPGATARVHGAQPMLRVAVVVQRVVRHVARAQVRPDVVLAPVGERVELRQAVHGVEFLRAAGRGASPTARGAGR